VSLIHRAAQTLPPPAGGLKAPAPEPESLIARAGRGLADDLTRPRPIPVTEPRPEPPAPPTGGPGAAVPGAALALDDAHLAAQGLLTRDSQGSRLHDEMVLLWRRLLRKWEEPGTTRPTRTRSLVVTSSAPGEGKTFISANLALTCAMQGIPVVLVDADLFRPSIGTRIGVSEGAGLADLLRGGVTGEIPLLTDPVSRMAVLRAGTDSHDAAESLTPDAVEAVLRRLEAQVTGGIVIIDTPPVLAANCTALLAEAAGSVLMLVKARDTSSRLVRSALDLLEGVGDLSVLLNQVPASSTENRFGWYYDPYAKADPKRRRK